MQPVRESGSGPTTSDQAAKPPPANGKPASPAKNVLPSTAQVPVAKGKQREEGPQRQLPSRSGRPQGSMKDQPNIVKQATPTAAPSSSRGRGLGRGRGRPRGAGPRASLHGALAQVVHPCRNTFVCLMLVPLGEGLGLAGQACIEHLLNSGSPSHVSAVLTCLSAVHCRECCLLCT